MKTIKIDYVPTPSFQPGSYSYVTTDVPLSRYYGKNRSKRRLGLKIFTDKFQENLGSFLWKRNNLVDCTKIQNIFHFNGLAPRVFDIIILETPERKFYAQVVEVLEDDERGDFDKDLVPKMTEVRKKYGIALDSWDPNPNHRYRKYLTDFSHYKFNHEVYENYLIKSFQEKVTWGSNPKPYQTVKELGIDGQRDLAKRIEAYELDKIDFKGKTVLDYGCSGGHMAHECLKRGAKYVVGIDLPKVAVGAWEMSNHLGFFNVDFYGDNFDHKGGRDIYSKIKELTGESKFDIVLYLSVQQLGWPTYLRDIVGEHFFLEGHSGDHDYTYEDRLKEQFDNVEYLGVSRDHSVRPVFRCSNN